MRQPIWVLGGPDEGSSSIFSYFLSSSFVYKIEELLVEANLNPATLRRAIGKSIKETESWSEDTPIAQHKSLYQYFFHKDNLKKNLKVILKTAMILF